MRSAPSPRLPADRRARATIGLAILTLAVGPLVVGCDSRPRGAVTARLVLDEGQSARALVAGARRSALAPRAVPDEVKRLEIYAVDAAGSTVATALLDELPSGNEQQLVRAGGTWRMDEVPVGAGYTLRARDVRGCRAQAAVRSASGGQAAASRPADGGCGVLRGDVNSRQSSVSGPLNVAAMGLPAGGNRRRTGPARA
jgi:hypothetical protein